MIDVHRHDATGTYSVSLRVDDFIDRHIHLQTTDEVEARQAAKHITAMAAAHWFGICFDSPELEWFDSLPLVVRRRVARAGVCDLPQNETDDGEGVTLSALLDKANELHHDDTNNKRTRNSAFKNLRKCFDVQRDVFTSASSTSKRSGGSYQRTPTSPLAARSRACSSSPACSTSPSATTSSAPTPSPPPAASANKTPPHHL